MIRISQKNLTLKRDEGEKRGERKDVERHKDTALLNRKDWIDPITD